ncbi:MAG: phosphomannomutase, partial [Patescibacteria group bacterium]
MNINPNIFKAYDLRGIYPKDINEETIVVITKAIYQFFLQKLQKDSLSVVLGRDMRTSTP